MENDKERRTIVNFEYLGAKFKLPTLDPPKDFLQSPEMSRVQYGIYIMAIFSLLGFICFHYSHKVQSTIVRRSTEIISCLFVVYCFGLVMTGLYATTDSWLDQQNIARTEIKTAIVEGKSNKYVKVQNLPKIKAIEKNSNFTEIIDEIKKENSPALVNGFTNLKVKYSNNKEEFFDKDQVIIQLIRNKATKPERVVARNITFTKLGEVCSDKNIKNFYNKKHVAIIKVYFKAKSKWQAVNQQ